jgi:CBS domain-containing protein
MTTVKNVLRTKGSDTLSVGSSVPVRDALRKMMDNNVGSLLVFDGGKLVGLFAERDFVRVAATAEEAISLGGVVGDVMVENVLYVCPDTTLEECMALMTEKRTRHLPVLDDEEVVGIVSIGDVVKQTIEDKEFMIEQLERYITGR